MSRWTLLEADARLARWDCCDVSIAIIGFGHIGGSMGSLLASEGFSVVGGDQYQDIIQAFAKGSCPFGESGLPVGRGFAWLGFVTSQCLH